jgi:hypothetical protein
VEVVRDRARRVLGVNGNDWERRLSGYLRSKGKEALADCDNFTLRKVMGFLSAVERGGNRKRGN